MRALPMLAPELAQESELELGVELVPIPVLALVGVLMAAQERAEAADA